MRKVIFLLLVLVLAIMAGCSEGGAQSTGNSDNGETKETQNDNSDFPSKDITMVIPYSPGGSTDTIGRILAKNVQDHLPNNQTIVVENKPGGGGAIGATDVSSAEPNGYTIGFTPNGPITLQPLVSNTSYGLEDFQPIIKAASFPQILAVSSESPWKSFDEWQEYVKENPGKLDIGTIGSKTLSEIAMVSLNSELDLETKQIPQDGAAGAANALIGGHVDGVVAPPDVLKQHVESGDVRPLMVMGNTENVPDFLNDVTRPEDIGIEVNTSVFMGIVAPKEIPDDVKNILHDAFKKTLEEDEVIEQINNFAIAPDYAPAKTFADELEENYQLNEEILSLINEN